MIKFSHIAPKSCLSESLAASSIHMALFHLTNDPDYCAAYRNAPCDVILDNSFFELGKCPPVDDMLEAAVRVNADYVVLKDGTLEGAARFKEAGFKVIAVPAGPQMEEQTISWAQDPYIDLVAISFTHAARAIGVLKNNPSARFEFMNSIDFHLIPEGKLHMLGMTNSVHEVLLMKPFWKYINSWDSSSAVWNGLYDIDIATMPVKNPLPVDFDTLLVWNEQCYTNIQYIRSLTRV